MAKLNLQNKHRAPAAPRGVVQGPPLPGVQYRTGPRSPAPGRFSDAADGKGGQWQKVIGHADDKQPADGTAVLDTSRPR